MTGTILVAFGFALTVAMLAFALLPKKDSEADIVRRRLDATDQVAAAAKAPDRGKPRQPTSRAVTAAIKKTAPYLARPVVPTTEEERSLLRTRLMQAGIRSESALPVFLASKTMLGLGAAGLALFLTWNSSQTTANIFGIVVGSGAVAFLLPNLWLSNAIAHRADKIKKGLSDVLDMMVIMVEAGLGLDGAMHRVGIEMAFAYPELSQELRITVTEMNMGVSRMQALRNLSSRVALKELETLVAAIVQAERFGAGIAKTLRTQGTALRVKRQQAAEEAAAKCALKLLFPLVLFIFPALMVVIGGPAIMNIVKAMEQAGL